MRTKKSKVTLTKKKATAKKKTTTKKLKKYAAGGKSSNCKPQKCGDMEYWSPTLCRCIKHLSLESLKYPPSGNDAIFYPSTKKAADSLFQLIKKKGKK